MTKTRAEFEAHIADLRSKKNDAVARATAAFDASAAMIVTEKGDAPELWILSGNMGKDKTGYRITFFSKDGPRGHIERATMDELVEEVASSRNEFQPVGDTEVIAWTSTPEFERGARRVAYIQAMNELGWLISNASSSDKPALIAAQTRAQSMEDEERATAFLQRVIHANSPRKNPGKPPVAKLVREIRELFDEAGLHDDFTVGWWSQREEHGAGKRDYAMVDPVRCDFLFSQRILSLDDAHRRAIVAHEVGHVLAVQRWEDESENGADRAAKEFLGVDIAYDKAFPGKGLQVCTMRMRKNPADEDFDLIMNPTPWVTNVLSAHFAELEDKVPPSWLPKLAKTKAVGTTFTGELTEFGCGAYGCVLPTLDPKIVLKVTTDDSEAEFAAVLADMLPTPICVAYYKVLYLQGKTRGPRMGVRTDGDGQKIFLLWREEASEVGKIDKVVGEHAERAIHAQHTAAMNAFIAMQRGEDARGLLEQWKNACTMMGRVPELAYVAEGLVRAVDEAKVFISDVHGGNLGLAMRSGKLTWVITDPGNVVVLSPAPTAAPRRSR